MEYPVQFSCSVMSNSVTPWTAAHQVSLSITKLWNLLKLISVECVMPSNHLIVCRPLLPLPSTFVLPMNIQDWSPLGLTGLIPLQYQGLSRVFSNTTVQRNQFFGAQFSLWSNSHIHTWLWRNYSFDQVDLCWQIMSLLFNMLSRLVISILPRSKCLLISWLQSPSSVILEPEKIKSVIVSHMPCTQP